MNLIQGSVVTERYIEDFLPLENGNVVIKMPDEGHTFVIDGSGEYLKDITTESYGNYFLFPANNGFITLQSSPSVASVGRYS